MKWSVAVWADEKRVVEVVGRDLELAGDLLWDLMVLLQIVGAKAVPATRLMWHTGR